MPIHFYQAIAGAPAPRPADDGVLPGHACRHARQASRRGWLCHPPADFAFEWYGDDLYVWVNDESLGPIALGEAVQHPDYTSVWDASAPDHLRGQLYPILSRSPVDANLVQIWTGYLIDFPSGWLAEVRPLVNRPWPEGYYLYDGFFPSTGALFATLSLRRQMARIYVERDAPLFQLQAVPSEVVEHPMDTTLFADWTYKEWTRYFHTVVLPSRARQRAHDARA